MTRSPSAFVDIPRSRPPKRPVGERITDWLEVESDLPDDTLRRQASRCMDCGIPFCHKGCPLGNYVPEWNELTGDNDWHTAITRLHATNNFPEFTGRTCPAPCEESCVLNINDDPVTIRQIEKQLADSAWDAGWVVPQPAARPSGKHVAIIGSGPAGLAAAQQLCRVGHAVTVYERDDRLGGLLRYGIPDFKLEKWTIDRRLEQMRAEGVTFRPDVNVGTDVPLDVIRAQHDVVLLAIGAQRARRMHIPGSELEGIHPAMEYLVQQNKVLAGVSRAPRIDAHGKHVVILGGGDTGADCLGTAHRQGAERVHHFHYKPAPPSERTANMPWPWWPMILRTSSSHEEGGEREWSVVAQAFSGDRHGRVRRMHCVHVEWVRDGNAQPRMREVPDSRFEVDADLVLLAIGFDGAESDALCTPGLGAGPNGTLHVDDAYRTSLPAVFACGDATRGASLVVWAIWEGREAARQMDSHLMGKTMLPTLPNRHPI